MDYTRELINNCVSIEDKKKRLCEASEQSFSSLSSLTTYKEVVDIHKKHRIYGLTLYDYKQVQEKIKKQNSFLEYNYIFDKISSTKIPLKKSGDIISNFHKHKMLNISFYDFLSI